MLEKLVINFDAMPAAVHGWRVVSHVRAGVHRWDPRRFERRAANYLRPHRRVTMHEVRKTFQGIPLVGANFVDFVLEYPDKLPSKQNCTDPRDEWRGIGIMYWCFGTVYRGLHANGGFCRYVRGIYWSHEESKWQEAMRLANNTYGGMDIALTF